MTIAPQLERNTDWRSASSAISRSTRRAIIDSLRIENVVWNGELGEIEFLGRIFDLEALPSTDGRFKNAARDIWQHRVNNPADWDDDWVYTDDRFRLLTGPDEQFVRFLCEIVHPAVRADRDEAVKLAKCFNDQLCLVGWAISEEEFIAGRPRYVGRKLGAGERRSVSRALSVADALDASWMQKEIMRLENAVNKDPSLAIGTAKELVESCCKTILGRCNVEIPKSANLPKLTKMVATELKLVPHL